MLQFHLECVIYLFFVIVNPYFSCSWLASDSKCSITIIEGESFHYFCLWSFFRVFAIYCVYLLVRHHKGLVPQHGVLANGTAGLWVVWCFGHQSLRHAILLKWWLFISSHLEYWVGFSFTLKLRAVRQIGHFCNQVNCCSVLFPQDFCTNLLFLYGGFPVHIWHIHLSPENQEEPDHYLNENGLEAERCSGPPGCFPYLHGPLLGFFMLT